MWDLNRKIDIRDIVYCGDCLRRMRWAGLVAHMGGRRGGIQDFGEET